IVYEQFFKNVWGKCNYGNPVLGTLESIKDINRQDLLSFYKTKYHPSNMVFSVAGNFQPDLFDSFNDLTYLNSKREMSSLIYKPFSSVTVTEREDLKQLHMLIGIEAPSRQDPDFNVFQVLNTLLGGGMSSKLFNRLREELGLVYTIDSGLISYPEGGLFFIYAATTPERFLKLKDELMNELFKIMKEGMNEQDINYGKERLKGKLLLSTESTYSTMMRNLDTGLAFGRPLCVEEMIERINAVDISRMDKVMEKYFSQNWILSLVTPKKALKQSLINQWEEKGIKF
ncbi:MAG: M16 family metallopeptidase, partial [Thermotogota bacterium]